LHVELSKQIAVQHPFHLAAFLALNMRKRVRKILAERWCQENAWWEVSLIVVRRLPYVLSFCKAASIARRLDIDSGRVPMHDPDRPFQIS
jgi:hypothetical protein